MNIARLQSSVLGRLGEFVVKIAETPEEIDAALKLRSEVFNTDTETTGDQTQSRDEDHFDAFCDHLIVCETSIDGNETPSKVIATYRLMGPEQAKHAGGFYSANEFEVAPLIKRHAPLKFLELGRSCVLPQYRNKRTIELLWHGSWAYVCRNAYDVMFGCASFQGTDPSQHEAALSFLRSQAKPDAGWEVNAAAKEVVAFSPKDYMPDMKAALRGLPPLIKGYLRLGAMFAEEAVIDRDFGTIDVLVLLPVARLNPRYVNYYGENAERHSL